MMVRNRLHFAVVVGINRYPELRPLQGAKGDAEKFKQWLLDPLGGGLLAANDPDALLPTGHVAAIVVDDAAVPHGLRRVDARPIRRQVCEALHDFREAIESHIEQNPDDWWQTRFYFYVSGHGIAPGPSDAALLMADAGVDSYDENISCSGLLSFLQNRQPFHEIVIFADCCRERVDNVPLGPISGVFARKNNGPLKTVVGYATHFGELAYEPPAHVAADKQRGYFTQALIEGLTGQAAEPGGSGQINSNNLALYVKQRVQDLTGKAAPGGSHGLPTQDPTMSADPAAPIVFRAGSQAREQQIHIAFPEGYDGDVVLRDTDGKVIKEHHSRDGMLRVKLRNGLYDVAALQADVVFRNDGMFRVHGVDMNVQL